MKNSKPSQRDFRISVVFIAAQYAAAVIAILFLSQNTISAYAFAQYLGFYLIIFAIPILLFIRLYYRQSSASYLLLNSNKIHYSLIISAFIFLIFFISHKFRFAPLEYGVDFYLAMIGALLAAVFEEIAFRGLYLKVAMQKLGFVKANILVSILFAALHFTKIPVSGYIEIPILFVFSLFMGYLYNKTDSLLNTIIVHAAYNAVMLLF